MKYLLYLGWLFLPAAPDCPTLKSGQSLPTACALILVTPGTAAQVTVPQANDLRLRITEPGSAERIVDSFEFGLETASFDQPGNYRLEIPAAGLMSRRALPLQAAAKWRQAETLATLAKQSGQPSRLAAAFTAWQALGAASAVARTELSRGDQALSTGDLIQADLSYESALVRCHALADHRCSAEAANNSGLVARRRGAFDRSLTRLTEAASAWKRLQNPALEALTLSNLGLLFWETGDFQRAIGYFDRSGSILRTGDPIALARVANNLGLCYQSLAEYERSRGYFEEALAAFTRERRPVDAGIARMNLGRSWMLEGNYPLARTELQAALNGADRTLRGQILTNLGQTDLALRKPSEARLELQQALTLHRQTGDRRLESTGLHYLGIAALQQNDLATARQDLTQAASLRRQIGLRDAAAESTFALAELERSAHHFPEARRLATEALELTESVRRQVPTAALRASFQARKRKMFDLQVDLETTPETALLAAERGRGRALLDLLAHGALLQPASGELRERRIATQRAIDLLALQLAKAPPERAAALRLQVDRLVAEDQQIEARVRSSQALGKPLTSIQDLQRALPGDTALLEYHLGEKQSYLWLVTAGRVEQFRLPPRASIEAEAAALLALFPARLDRQRSPQKQRDFQAALRQVSFAVLAPLSRIQLPPRLILALDGVLTQVPFAALAGSQGQPLGLVHDLVQIPAASYLLAGRAPKRASDFPQRVLVLADPVFGAQPLARLPFTGEIDALSALVKPAQRKVLRGLDASAEMLGQQHLSDYAFLHFSTHALIDDRIPELSRIALSMVNRAGQPVDGFLRPHQLAQFRLDGATVVLSACGTALGKQVLGEGLAGFTASLFAAGASQLVLTLSEVDAEAASEFLAATYRQALAPQPASTEHAITLARQSLAKSKRWADPYYWASFVVYGRPAKLD